MCLTSYVLQQRVANRDESTILVELDDLLEVRFTLCLPY